MDKLLDAFKTRKLLFFAVLVGIAALSVSYVLNETESGADLFANKELWLTFKIGRNWQWIFWPSFAAFLILDSVFNYLYSKTLNETLMYVIVSFLIGHILFLVYFYVAHRELFEFYANENLTELLVEYYLIRFGISFASSFASSFLGFHIRTRNIRGVANMESKVLDYIKSQNGVIQISKCALNLGISAGEVKAVLEALKQKGIVNTRAKHLVEEINKNIEKEELELEKKPRKFSKDIQKLTTGHVETCAKEQRLKEKNCGNCSHYLKSECPRNYSRDDPLWRTQKTCELFA